MVINLQFENKVIMVTSLTKGNREGNCLEPCCGDKVVSVIIGPNSAENLNLRKTIENGGGCQPES